MSNNEIEKEILELTVKLNKALKKLENESEGFLDKKLIEDVISINNKLEEKIKLKNQ